jgi:hypothetical protein
MQANLKMQEFAESKIEKLSELTATPTSQLKLVLDAWAQVGSFARIVSGGAGMAAASAPLM